MLIDLETGISLKIEGELGKNQTLPIDSLIKISQSLQDLVLTIAKYDIDSNESIDLENFKLELDSFTKSSAVPRFVFTKRINHTIYDNNEQRKNVNLKINKIFSITNDGNYYQLKDLYPSAIIRNEIVKNLYEFTGSFNNSPVKIFSNNNENDVYKIQKFKPEVKNNLLVKIEDVKKEKINERAIAIVRITKSGEEVKKKIIEEVFINSNNSLSYSPEIININGKQFVLKYPLRCLFEKEDDYFVINNEILGIIGTGKNLDDAEQNFNEEFDYLFKKLNSLNDNQLSKKMLIAKTTINNYVKEVI